MRERLPRDCHLQIDIAPDLPPVLADEGAIVSALINLLDNSVEATEAPGRIEARARRRDGELELTVSDSGRGIPAADRDKLFQPYFSTKGRGTGMGLAIAQRIVADHGGSIRVEDNEPRGTRFVVNLPQEPAGSIGA